MGFYSFSYYLLIVKLLLTLYSYEGIIVDSIEAQEAVSRFVSLLPSFKVVLAFCACFCLFVRCYMLNFHSQCITWEIRLQDLFGHGYDAHLLFVEVKILVVLLFNDRF